MNQELTGERIFIAELDVNLKGIMMRKLSTKCQMPFHVGQLPKKEHVKHFVGTNHM